MTVTVSKADTVLHHSHLPSIPFTKAHHIDTMLKGVEGLVRLIRSAGATSVALQCELGFKLMYLQAVMGERAPGITVKWGA